MDNTDFIEKVINIMKNNELSEVLIEDNVNSLYIKTDGITALNEIKQTDENILIEDKITEKENKKIYPVISNMIGIFFSKPSPMEKPFVKEGDRVEKGQQICIIETIKLMNKITSEVSGRVKEICIEDGKPVEYGQTIMYIEQD